MSQSTSGATASGPRRIAPGPISESASAPAAAQRRGRLPSRRIGVSVACEACRKRKTRVCLVAAGNQNQRLES